MHREGSKRKEVFERKIAIADRVQTIGGNSRKAEVLSERFTVERKCAAGKSARAEWADIGTRSSRGDSFSVTMKGLAMRKKPVRKKQRLGVLHVRITRHGHF